MFKKILIVSLYVFAFIGLVAYFWFSAGFRSKELKVVGIEKIDVTISDTSLHFITDSIIIQQIAKEGIKVKESKLSHINVYDLENALDNIPSLKKAEVHYTINGNLNISCIQRQPIVRFMGDSYGFYIDNERIIFPLDSNFTADVPIVSGKIKEMPFINYTGHINKANIDSKWYNSIFTLAFYINQKEEWNSLIEQIFVDDYERLILTPRVGQHEIIFGPPESIETKFQKLHTFYTHILPNKGWNRYNYVDLSFENQIVCKIRDYQTDSISNEQNIKNLNI